VEAAGSSRWAAVGVIAGSAGEPVSLRGANGLGAVQRGDPSEVEIWRRAGRRWGRGQCEAHSVTTGQKTGTDLQYGDERAIFLTYEGNGFFLPRFLTIATSSRIISRDRDALH
jgi:hypothetical protein